MRGRADGSDGRRRFACGQPWQVFAYDSQEFLPQDQRDRLQSSVKLATLGAFLPDDSIALLQSCCIGAAMHQARTVRPPEQAVHF